MAREGACCRQFESIVDAGRGWGRWQAIGWRHASPISCLLINKTEIGRSLPPSKTLCAASLGRTAAAIGITAMQWPIPHVERPSHTALSAPALLTSEDSSHTITHTH